MAMQTLELKGSDREAIEIALNELDSWIGIVNEDQVIEHEENLMRLRWASKKLHALIDA